MRIFLLFLFLTGAGFAVDSPAQRALDLSGEPVFRPASEHSSDCGVVTSLREVSTGLAEGPVPELTLGQPVELSLAYDGCQRVQAVKIQLPDELWLLDYPDYCELEADGLNCQPPARRNRGGAALQIDYVIEPRLDARQRAALDAGDDVIVRWSAAAQMAGPDQSGINRVETGGEYSIRAGTFVQIGQPNSIMNYAVEAGTNFRVQAKVLHNNSFVSGNMGLAQFAYHDYSTTMPAVSCSGAIGGSVVACTGSNGNEHEVYLDFTAPSQPGSYLGSYSAEACLGTFPNQTDCVIKSNEFTVEVFSAETEANVTVEKTGPVSAVAGDAFQWTIDITNAGPDPAEDFTLTDSLPAGVSLVSVSPGANGTPLSCVGGGGVVGCGADSLPVGDYTVTITAVGRPVPAGQQFVDVENVCGAGAGNGSVNDSGCVSTVRVFPDDNEPEAGVTVEKTGPAEIEPGQPFEWSIVVTNSGPNAANDFLVEDILPGNVTFDSVSSTEHLSCAEAGGVVSCSSLLLPVGTHIVTITVVAPASIPASGITNDCTASAGSGVVVDDLACVHTVNEEDGGDPDPDPPRQIDMTAHVTGPVSAPAGSQVEFRVGVNLLHGMSHARLNTSAHDAGFTGFGDIDFVSQQVPGGVWSACYINTQSLTCENSKYFGGPSRPEDEVVVTYQLPDNPGAVNPKLCVRAVPTTANVIDSNPDNNTDCHEINVFPSADLSVAKSTLPETVQAGEEYDYLLGVGNLGPSTATGVTVTTSLPAGATYLGNSGATAWDCAASGGLVICSWPGNMLTINSSIRLHVRAPLEGGDYSNCAHVTGNEPDPATWNNTSCSSVTVTPVADLAVVGAGTESIHAGASFSHYLTVSNEGPSPATNITLSGDFPAEGEYQGYQGDGWACTVAGTSYECESAGDLQRNRSLSVLRFDFAAASEPGNAGLCAEVAGAELDPVLANNADCVSTQILPLSDLQLNVMGDNDVLAAETFEHHVWAYNGGPSTAGGIAVEYPLPEGVGFVGFGVDDDWACSLQAGDVARCLYGSGASPAGLLPAITIRMTAPDEPDSLLGCAEISGAHDDPNTGNNSDCWTTEVRPQSTVEVTKAASASEVVSASPFTYSIELNNAGPSMARSGTLQDDLPAGMVAESLRADAALGCVLAADGTSFSCSSFDLASREAVVIEFDVTAPSEGGEVTNTCQWGFVADSNVTQIDGCEVTTQVRASADLVVAKSVNEIPVLSGQPFTYTISIDQLGPSTAENVTVQDPLPAGVTLQSVDAPPEFQCFYAVGGTDVSCSAASLPIGQYAIEIDVIAPVEPGPISNVCVVGSDTDDPNPNDPDDCRSDDEVEPVAVIVLDKTSSPSPVYVGQPMLYTINVENQGPNPAENFTLTDSLPAEVVFEAVAADSPISCAETGGVVSCQATTLPVGHYAIEINVVPEQTGDLLNICVGSSDTADPSQPDPGACEDENEVFASADLSVSKIAAIVEDGQAGPAITAVDSGAAFVYLVTVTNHGPSAAENIVLVDDLPGEITGVTVEGWSGECSHADGQVTCLADELGPEQSLLLQIDVIAPEAELDVINLAAVSSDTYDPELGNNATEHLLNVLETPVVGLAKASTQVQYIGGSLWDARVLFTVQNYGNVPLDSVQVVDDLSAVFPASVAWSVTDLTVSGDLTEVNPLFDGVLDQNLLAGNESLPVNGSAEIRLEIQFDPGAEAGPFWNSAEISGVSTVGSVVTDLSHNGLDPNPDGTHPGNHSLPTPIDYTEDAGVGVAKWVEAVTYEGDGVQTFSIGILVRNYGNVQLSNVQVTDRLDDTFGTDSSVAVFEVSGLAVEGHFTEIDPGYDGVGVATLLAGTEALPVGAESVIRFNVSIELGSDDIGPWMNRAYALGYSPSGNEIADWSQAGMDPNPSQSGDPTDDNDPTPVLPLLADIETEKELVYDGGPGGLLVWLIAVTNHGPDPAFDLVVTDTLPAGVVYQSAGGALFDCSESGGVVTCNRDHLGVGERDTIEVQATAPLDGGDLTNVCDAWSAIGDPVPENNACQTTDPVDPVANISVAKSVVGPVYAGQPVTYLIEIDQAGPSAASGVLVVDPLDPALEFRSVSADGPFECAVAGNEVSCLADTLPVGQYVVAIEVLAPDQLGPISNVCVVTAETGGLVGAGDVLPGCEHTVEPESVAQLAMTKLAEPDNIPPGSVFDWVITVDQLGPNDAEGVVIVDHVPASSSVLSVSADGPFECAAAGNEVSCLANTLPVGQYQIRIETRAPVEPGPISNVCVIESDTHMLEPPVCEGVGGIGQPPVLLTGAQPTRSRVNVGEAFSYLVQVANDGESEIAELVVDVTATGPAMFSGAESRSIGWCDAGGEIGIACIADVIDAGTQLVAELHFVAQETGRHRIDVRSSASSALAAESVLSASAAVDVVPTGVPLIEAHPIPTMSRVGSAALIVMLMLLAGWQIRRFSA